MNTDTFTEAPVLPATDEQISLRLHQEHANAMKLFPHARASIFVGINTGQRIEWSAAYHRGDYCEVSGSHSTVASAIHRLAEKVEAPAEMAKRRRQEAARLLEEATLIEAQIA